jgi:peroxiredoxin
MAFAIALVALLTLADLGLTFAIIRWIRRHGVQHATRQGPHVQPPPRLPVGTQIPEFTTTVVGGGSLSLADLAGARSAVAFLSASCQPCREQLPEFQDFARTIPGGRSQVLAVIIGSSSSPGMADFVAELTDIASVAVEPRQGAAQEAFSVRAFPTFFVLDERGRVETSAPAMRFLTETEQV